MKKMFAIFFLTIYMISATELSQLLKFPILIEHYFEHKEKSPEISVVDFLILHYNNHLENHPQDDDFDQDKKLPFITSGTALIFIFILPQPVLFEAVRKNEVGNSSKINFLNIFITSQFLSSIWQPPKYC